MRDPATTEAGEVTTELAALTAGIEAGDPALGPQFSRLIMDAADVFLVWKFSIMVATSPLVASSVPPGLIGFSPGNSDICSVEHQQRESVNKFSQKHTSPVSFLS